MADVGNAGPTFVGQSLDVLKLKHDFDMRLGIVRQALQRLDNGKVMCRKVDGKRRAGPFRIVR